ncbi:hypothetical protein PQR02_33330 [Paraburkholderia sediminicola]|uniref:Uncharacterized protein n=1 Tax=Paraburkholderia rhynchosiae TaxID=487049 RepID=A0ACC7NQV6_9BURK
MDTIPRDLYEFHHDSTIMPHARANEELAQPSRLPSGVDAGSSECFIRLGDGRRIGAEHGINENSLASQLHEI